MTLAISDHQLQAMQSLADKGFLKRLTDWLQVQPVIAAQNRTRDELAALAQEAVRTGHELGLTWESSLSAFAALSLTMGANFHRDPNIRSVLEEKDDTPDRRWLRLSAKMSDASWHQSLNGGQS